MRTMIYFVLVPTKQLRDLAGKFGFEDLIGNEVWHTYRHDPSGLEHSLEEFEDAAWTSFVGSFDLSQGAEREAAEQFLAECVELGFRACWEVHQAGAGDNVEQLLEKAKKYEGYARENLVRVQRS